jgi:hypothetical protein
LEADPAGDTEGNVSLASYTETKLDAIYGRSIQLSKELKKLDRMANKSGKNRMDVYISEQIRNKQ